MLHDETTWTSIAMTTVRALSDDELQNLLRAHPGLVMAVAGVMSCGSNDASQISTAFQRDLNIVEDILIAGCGIKRQEVAGLGLSAYFLATQVMTLTMVEREGRPPLDFIDLGFDVHPAGAIQ